MWKDNMYKRSDLTQPVCLAQAAAQGDADKLISIISSGKIDKSCLNQALLQATEHCTTTSDHLQCVESLLSAGASINSKTPFGVSPLMKASESGQIQLVELLCRRGALVNDKALDLKTPLHFAVDTNNGDNSDVVQLLLNQGADLNAMDNAGRTALHCAAARGASHSLKVLLDAGATLNLMDKARQSPLDLAVFNDRQVCVQVLRSRVSEVKTKLRSPQNQSPVMQMLETKKDQSPVSVLPGPELGEELETKSGSSFSSARGSSEAGNNTEEDWRKQLGRVMREVEDKKKEFREEETLRECAEGELSVLEKEFQWVQIQSQISQEDARHKLTCLQADLEKKREDCSCTESRLSFNSQPLLTLKKKPIKTNDRQVIQSLREDINHFITDLESWQKRVSNVMNRAVERWSNFVTSYLPKAQTKIYGSFANSLHLPSSDIDLVILRSGLSILETLRILDVQCRNESWVTQATLIPHAYIPVLQLTIVQDGCNIRLDVTVQESKHRGQKCTQVVKSLLQQIPLLRQVFLTLKQLFHVCEANLPYTGGLGSYSLFVMTAALMKKETLHSVAEYVYRFLQYYGYECQYLSPISMEDDHSDEFQSNYPGLIVSDPATPQNNVARASNLSFLVVTFK